MRPKSFAEYEEYRPEHHETLPDAYYDPQEKRLVYRLLEPMNHVQSFRITNLPYMHRGRPAIARVYGPVGVEITEVPADLKNTLVQTDYIGAISEAANAGCLDILPPEPILSTEPKLGETAFRNSVVKQPNGPDFPFNTWYRTDAVGEEVRTTLIEQPDDLGMVVYHYTFDGELKRVVFGAVMADNSVPRLTVYERVAQG
jgi:hypothetical protein